MKRCRACRRHFDHRILAKCPHCGKTTTTIQALRAENRRLRAQVASLQEHNNAELERRRKAEAIVHFLRSMGFGDTAFLDDAHIIAGICANNALFDAIERHPEFAITPDQAMTILAEEVGEVARAVRRKQFDETLTEITHVLAVCLRFHAWLWAWDTVKLPAPGLDAHFGTFAERNAVTLGSDGMEDLF